MMLIEETKIFQKFYQRDLLDLNYFPHEKSKDIQS
jgi:hypothetical protein